MNLSRVSAMRLDLPASRLPLGMSLVARAGAAAALVLVALIHVSLAPMYGAATPYIGILFWTAGGAALLAAAGILAGVRFAWCLGVTVAVGTAVALLVASTVGLPRFMDTLSAPHASATLILDSSIVAIYVAAASMRRSPLGA